MSTVRQFLALSVVCVLVVPVTVAQEPPKPGPELAQLKQMEGTWEATVKMGDTESKGTMTYKMELGGMWLVGNYKGEFFGQKFEGKGLDSYDPAKKKYVSVWVDSMSTGPMILEGTLDKEAKVMTKIGEGPGQDGKPVKYKIVTEGKDENTRIDTFSNPDKEGKYQVTMTITYKREK